MQVPNTAPGVPAQQPQQAQQAQQAQQQDLVYYDPVGRTSPRWRLRLAGALGALCVVGVPAAALSDPKRSAAAVRRARRLASRLVPRSDAPEAANEAVLDVASTPADASIEVDEEAKGRTPTALSLPPGQHRLVVRRQGYVDAVLRVELPAASRARVATDLWAARPQVARVRPALPGAAIAGATFLDDGTPVVSLLLPGGARQLWLADPAAPALRADGGALPENCPAAALSPDGVRLAWVVTSARAGWTAAGTRPDELRMGASAIARGSAASPTLIHTGAVGERLLDVAWTPDGRHLLVVAQRGGAGPAIQPDGQRRTRLLWLAVDGNTPGTPQELAEIPSDVTAGTWTWSPDARWVAFASKAGETSSLCLLRTPESGTDPRADGPALRYVGDLARATGPLPSLPATWSHDGTRLMYAAAPSTGAAAGAWSLGGKAEAPLAGVRLDAAPPAPDASGALTGRPTGFAPIWRADGTLATLARPKNKGPLLIRFAHPADPPGEPFATVPLAALPAVAPSACAVRWDPARAQAFVAVRESQLTRSPQASCWLVRFGAAAGAETAR